MTSYELLLEVHEHESHHVNLYIPSSHTATQRENEPLIIFIPVVGIMCDTIYYLF